MKKTIFVIIFSFITNSNGFINASASEISAKNVIGNLTVFNM